MNFKKAYSSDTDDIVNDFYVPALAEAVEYERLAGFFSSTSLAIAARGMVGLVKNDGVMRLVVSPRLTRKDIDVLTSGESKLEKVVGERMLLEIDELQSEFVRDHVFALAWLVAKRRLEIRVAVPYDSEGNLLDSDASRSAGMFHQKVGIMKDRQGDVLTFSGSVNESASSWLENIEEFKVFSEWEEAEREYIEADRAKFSRFWNGEAKNVKTMDIPTAVRRRLVKIAPKDVDLLNLGRFYRRREGPRSKITLFEHQQEAVKCWINNDMKGIFEMATGTGKTFTALACFVEASRKCPSLLAIVCCPTQHLVQQWKKEVKKFGLRLDIIIADSTNHSWRRSFSHALLDIALGHKKKCIVITTHRTFSSDDFVGTVKDVYRKDDFPLMVIGDEVHGLGATKTREALLDDYLLRLGLSATPKRWFDLAGTEIIYDYFGGTVREFTLKDAINTVNPLTKKTYLSPFRYIPKFVSLTGEELEEYLQLSQAIGRRYSGAKGDLEKDDILQILMFKRADVIKNAESKLLALSGILDEIGNEIKWCITYCSPQQIGRAMLMFRERDLIAHRFTMEQGTKPEDKYGGVSEREFILDEFAKGNYQVLAAMKCLDEGVDIPPARIGILMASSGNPREYIQRIGRLIRRYPDKAEARIYDIIVVPSIESLPGELKAMEWMIFKRELKRYEEVAMVALNSAEALKSVYDVKKRIMEAIL